MPETIREHRDTSHGPAPEPFLAPAANAVYTPVRPEWIRLPKPGSLCQHSGLSRTVIYMLCKEGKVDSRVLRRRGAIRGIRLVRYGSLMRYIQSLDV